MSWYGLLFYFSAAEHCAAGTSNGRMFFFCLEAEIKPHPLSRWLETETETRQCSA
jgi:hypothetical protein